MPSQKDRSHLNNNFIPVIPIEIAITVPGDFISQTVLDQYGGPTPIIRKLYPWTDNPTKLSGPVAANIPADNGRGVAWSPNGEYLAVAHDSSSFITIYQRSSKNFTKLSGPTVADLPVGNGMSVAWSLGAGGVDLLAIAHQASPFITVYLVEGLQFTKTADPATLPTGMAFGVSFSPNGQFLAVGHANSGFVTIYEKTNSLPIFTKLSITDVPTGTAVDVAFSPNGEFLAVGHVNSSFITIYQRSNSSYTFNKISGPVGSDIPTGTVNGLSWSPDGRYLAIAHENSSFVTVYKRSQTTFTKLSGQPFSVPAGAGQITSFSPNGQFLAVGHATSIFLTVYHLQNDELKRLPNPLTLPASTVENAKWSPDGQFLALVHPNSSFITIYQTIENPPLDNKSNIVVKIIGMPREGD